MQPYFIELNNVPEVMVAFARFHHLPGCLLLDSAMRVNNSDAHPVGRYSFLTAEPFDWIEHETGTAQPFRRMREFLRAYKLDRIPDLPPFQGGYAGLLGYELNHSLERNIPRPPDDFGIPVLALGAYDIVLAWDHHLHRAWIISSGLPETDEPARSLRASKQIDRWRAILENDSTAEKFRDNEFQQPDFSSPRKIIGNQYEVPGPFGLLSNFSKESYLAAVQQCIDYIRAGDIFQVNLAQRLLIPARRPAAQLYRELRKCNPATFAAYFDPSQVTHRNQHGLTPFQIISAAPERLVAVRDRIVETRPIKGTRRRTGIPLVDIQTQEQLLASIKDRAENIMIVDLMRNDLSKSCDDDSVVVTQLCELERYQSVLHLVSAVEGRLRYDADLVDLMESVFPGGSVTGAPKHRAMQIIGELEPDARGAYCGSIGYFGFDGSADFSILIRTITSCGGWWQIPVGGGIVSGSKPAVEYEETWTKAAGMLRAVEACQQPAKMICER